MAAYLVLLVHPLALAAGLKTLEVLERDDWLDLARKLDCDYSYVDERDVFPAAVSGSPRSWFPASVCTGARRPLRAAASSG